MERQEADHLLPEDPQLTRRSLLKGIGFGAVAAGAGGVLAACGSGIKGAGSSTSGTINIGFITPLTGQLAGFASGDNYVLSQIRQSSVYKSGIKIGSKTYKININVQDSQSSPTRAAQVAQQLILGHADLILTTSTPETTNPVAGACERLGTPCLSTVVPWESWYAGLGGNPLQPTKAFTYATMFFFGLKEFQGCFAPMWNGVHTNKVVACQYPNDSDGNAFRGGFEPLIKASGYKVVDGGPYTDGTADFTSMISLFKSKNAAAGLQHVLEAGRTAGLQAEDRHRGQGAAVPGRHRRPGPAGQQHRDRLVVGTVHAEHVVADRPVRQRAGSRLPDEHRAPVGPIDRLNLFVVRGGQGGVQRGLGPAR